MPLTLDGLLKKDKRGPKTLLLGEDKACHGSSLNRVRKAPLLLSEPKDSPEARTPLQTFPSGRGFGDPSLQANPRPR